MVAATDAVLSLPLNWHINNVRCCTSHHASHITYLSSDDFVVDAVFFCSIWRIVLGLSMACVNFKFIEVGCGLWDKFLPYYAIIGKNYSEKKTKRK